MKISLSLLAAVVLAPFAAPVAASPITIYSSNLNSVAGIDTAPPAVSLDQQQSGNTAYGFRSLGATFAGSSSTTYVNWIDTGAGALFDFDFAHTRTGAVNAMAESYVYLTFTATQNTTYSLSGLYTATGPANRTAAWASLEDLTAGPFAVLFNDLSRSDNTANENFILGVPGDGDAQNTTQGSLTGTLLAGHQYLLFFDYYVKNVAVTDNGAAATGCLTLSIGGATGSGACGSPVPEPSTWLLLGTGLAAVAARRRSKRRMHSEFQTPLQPRTPRQPTGSWRR